MAKLATTTIRLPQDTKDALDKAAAAQDRTRSWLIQKIVADWLKARVKLRKPRAAKK
jgi:predicted transcriptional regulator